MKKMVFCAVALIGFTVASYGANTVEKVEVRENLTLASNNELTPYYCLDDWERMVDRLVDYYEATLDEAFAIADRGFDACL